MFIPFKVKSIHLLPLLIKKILPEKDGEDMKNTSVYNSYLKKYTVLNC